MIVAYTGAFIDYSGMGEASRQFVTALDTAGVKVVGKCEQYAPAPNMDFGAAGRIAIASCANSDPYRVQILHVTPDECPRLKEKDVYTISHFFWETDRLPPTFVEGLNVVDEIWTGSQATVDAIRKSGIDKPVYIFPQPTHIYTDIGTDVKPYESSQTEHFDGYMFYSIFEWHARKNPELLIDAYMSEFDGTENVGLLLKTYYQSPHPSNLLKVRDMVSAVVAKYKSPPQLFLELNPLSSAGIQSIHKRGDCYVSPHHGEGWGIPIVEAMVSGNPVIVTGYCGVAEYLTDWVDGYLLPYKMEAVRGMGHASRYYCDDQNWATVKQEEVQSRMRNVFANPHDGHEVGLRAQQLCRDKFNYFTVGEQMRQRLETIGA